MSSTSQSTHRPSELPRRTVLRGAAVGTTGVAVAATAVTLAGCNSQDTPQPADIPTAEVPVGSGVVKNNWVVAQPTAGEYHAYSAVCPHQGCLVQTITKDQITCPCHNSVFKVSDGSVVAGPAQEGLHAAKVVKSGDTLSVSAE